MRCRDRRLRGTRGAAVPPGRRAPRHGGATVGFLPVPDRAAYNPDRANFSVDSGAAVTCGPSMVGTGALLHGLTRTSRGRGGTGVGPAATAVPPADDDVLLDAPDDALGPALVAAAGGDHASGRRPARRHPAPGCLGAPRPLCAAARRVRPPPRGWHTTWRAPAPRDPDGLLVEAARAVHRPCDSPARTELLRQVCPLVAAAARRTRTTRCRGGPPWTPPAARAPGTRTSRRCGRRRSAAPRTTTAAMSPPCTTCPPPRRAPRECLELRGPGRPGRARRRARPGTAAARGVRLPARRPRPRRAARSPRRGRRTAPPPSPPARRRGHSLAGRAAQPPRPRPRPPDRRPGRPGAAAPDRPVRHVLPLGPGLGRPARRFLEVRQAVPAWAVAAGSSPYGGSGQPRSERRRTRPPRRPLGFCVVTTVRLPLFPLNTVLFPWGSCSPSTSSRSATAP
ncbi:hypothetical protein SCYAM73S_03925 [Streptomyces cyaneofuscatus]